jgi:hypothetical protein
MAVRVPVVWHLLCGVLAFDAPYLSDNLKKLCDNDKHAAWENEPTPGECFCEEGYLPSQWKDGGHMHPCLEPADAYEHACREEGDRAYWHPLLKECFCEEVTRFQCAGSL